MDWRNGEDYRLKIKGDGMKRIYEDKESEEDMRLN